jgi:hypothetical protein
MSDQLPNLAKGIAIMSNGHSPTEQAKYYFKFAESAALQSLNGFKRNPDKPSESLWDLSNSIGTTAKGLHELAIAIRATYIKLEQIEAKIDRLNLR